MLETQQPHDLSVYLEQETAELRMLLKRTSEHIAIIGHRLIAVRERIASEKQFNTWCAESLGIAHTTADNFMNVATLLETHPKIGQFDPSIVYMLAAPSMPEEIVHGVETGEIQADAKTVKALKRQYQENVGESENTTTSRPHSLTPRQVIDHLIEAIQKSELYTEDTDQMLIDQVWNAVQEAINSIQNGRVFQRNRREKTIEGLSTLVFAIESVLELDEE